VYILSSYVGLALIDQSLALEFCFDFEFIDAAHSRITDATAGPPSADHGKEVRLAIGYGLTAEGTEGAWELT
jgi:hypothetical protein